jgi:hypothetical protein
MLAQRGRGGRGSPFPLGRGLRRDVMPLPRKFLIFDI